MSAAITSAKLTAELSTAFPNVDVRILRDVVGTFFWKWYHEHANDVVIRRTVIVFRVTVKVRDLHPFFVALFGQPPVMLG